MYNPFARNCNKHLDAFNDVAKITKSYISTVNTLALIHVPEEHEEMDNNVSCQKCGRPIGSKDVAPYKKRGRNHKSSLLNSEQPALREETNPMKRSSILGILKS